MTWGPSCQRAAFGKNRVMKSNVNSLIPCDISTAFAYAPTYVSSAIFRSSYTSWIIN